ncbi:MAG: cation transporter, partial [Proteobacteria bacterium]
MLLTDCDLAVRQNRGWKLNKQHDSKKPQSDGHHAHSAGGHSHNHIPTKGKAFGIGIGLNVIFVIAEVIYGVSSNSVALVADAAHNAGDVLGLILAWVAMILARRTPTSHRTYGLRRSTILATLANAILLLIAVGGVIWEAVVRIKNPGSVDGSTVIIVAAIGVFINGVSAFFFFKDKDSDANVRGAFLHLAADAAVSVGVVIGGFIILKTGWHVIDPVISIIISLVILVSTWSLFKDALNLSLDSVPKNIDILKVKSSILEARNIRSVHDLHVWSMSTTEVALTAHLVTTDKEIPTDVLSDLRET